MGDSFCGANIKFAVQFSLNISIEPIFPELLLWSGTVPGIRNRWGSLHPNGGVRQVNKAGSRFTVESPPLSQAL